MSALANRTSKPAGRPGPGPGGVPQPGHRDPDPGVQQDRGKVGTDRQSDLSLSRLIHVGIRTDTLVGMCADLTALPFQNKGCVQQTQERVCC